MICFSVVLCVFYLFIYLFMTTLCLIWLEPSTGALKLLTHNTELIFFFWWRLFLTAPITWKYRWTLFSCLPHSVHARTWTRIQQRYQRDIFTLTITLQTENNTTQNMFAFSIMPSNAYWQILLICVDIYVFAMITRDWLEKTESMIETEIHYQHKQLN